MAARNQQRQETHRRTVIQWKETGERMGRILIGSIGAELMDSIREIAGDAGLQEMEGFSHQVQVAGHCNDSSADTEQSPSIAQQCW